MRKNQIRAVSALAVIRLPHDGPTVVTLTSLEVTPAFSASAAWTLSIVAVSSIEDRIRIVSPPTV